MGSKLQTFQVINMRTRKMLDILTYFDANMHRTYCILCTWDHLKYGEPFITKYVEVAKPIGIYERMCQKPFSIFRLN